MLILFGITNFLFLLWTVRNIFFWINLWQLKEYRFDRLFIHLRETSQGKNLLFSPLSITKILGILLYGVVVYDYNLLLFYKIFVSLIFVVQGYFLFKEIFSKNIKFPVFTLKANSIFLGVILLILLLFVLSILERSLWILVLDRITPILVAIMVFIFSFPSEFYRDIKIEKAINKISKHKKLLVIGVTGSYGKTSTKDYIAQILEKKFKVLKTKENNNTPIGIANTILSGLEKDTQIFVVEMGAYKKGEIWQMCQIVKPKIGVLTAINNQHLSLFGNIENITEAKYELINAIPKNGLAMFNGNNPGIFDLYQKTKKNKILYGIINNDDKNFDISASDIKVNKENIEFTVNLKDKHLKMKANLIGAQNLQNILPAIYLAKYLNMTDEEIIEAASSVFQVRKTMILDKLSNGLTIIDDTYNANPDAVVAAINYSKIYRGKKFLVLQPMIELGKGAETDHYKTAKEISKKCNFLFLTNKNFNKSIIKGIKDGGGNCFVKVATPGYISRFISSSISKGDIAIFEGKEASFVLEKLKKRVDFI